MLYLHVEIVSILNSMRGENTVRFSRTSPVIFLEVLLLPSISKTLIRIKGKGIAGDSRFTKTAYSFYLDQALIPNSIYYCAQAKAYSGLGQ